MHRLHGEGLPQDAGTALGSAHIGKPIPGAETGDRHDEPLANGRQSREKRFRSGLHRAVQEAFPILAQEADVHAADMPVDTRHASRYHRTRGVGWCRSA